MIDTRLPMMIQQPNVLAALDAGTTAASNQANVLRQAEGQNLFRQYGAGAMQGDQNALRAIGAFDPMMGQQMQANQLGMQLDQGRLTQIRQQVAAAARAEQDKASVAQQAAEAKQKMQALGIAWLRQDEAAFAQASEAFAEGGLPMTEDALRYADMVVGGLEDGLSGLISTQPSMSDRYKVVGGQLVDMFADGGPSPVPGIEGRSAGLSITTPDGMVISQGGPAVMDRANLQAGSGQTRIADPSSPTGTRIVAEPGSEAASAQEASARAAAASAENERTRSNVVMETTGAIRQALTKGGNRSLFDAPEVGIVGERLSRLGLNQEAVDVALRMETLQGMVAFDRLEKMKQASATGASGLGQVTEREIALLAAQLGALSPRASREVILRTMDTIESVFGKLSPEAQAYLTGASSVEPWTAPQAAPQQAAPTAPAMDFSRMSLSDLTAVDLMTLPSEALDAYEAALDRALGAQQ